MAFDIFLSPPNLNGKEAELVKDALDSNWIAPYGPHLNLFEQEMADYLGIESAVACTSGTAAIHLALRWFGVEKDDFVFCSDFTFIGSCAPILYQQAIPVFIDSELDSWNMSPVALEKAFQWAQEQGKMPKAVIVVDLYGESADWDRILPICRKYGVPVIEDSAEALGSTYKGKPCGSFGNVGILSFNGNKIITTSGGGMILSSDEEAIAKMRFWSTQAREQVIWYEHEEYGYNYRMSNISAAIGRGQLSALSDKVARRREIHARYTEELKGTGFNIKQPYHEGSNHWLTLMCLEGSELTPIEIVTRLQNSRIECRPVWKPMHLQPLFKNSIFFSENDSGMNSDTIFNNAICLPSGDGMSEEQLAVVIEEILKNQE